MNILLLSLVLTMSTSLTFENPDRSAFSEGQIVWVKEHCKSRNLERMEFSYNEHGVRTIRCWSLTDPEVDVKS